MPRHRDLPMDRDELKIRRGLTITPTAWEGLQNLAERLGIKSRSELIESLGRGDFEILPATGGEDSLGELQGPCSLPAA